MEIEGCCMDCVTFVAVRSLINLWLKQCHCTTLKELVLKGTRRKARSHQWTVWANSFKSFLVCSLSLADEGAARVRICKYIFKMYKRVPYKSLHPQEDKRINGAYSYDSLIWALSQIFLQMSARANRNRYKWNNCWEFNIINVNSIAQIDLERICWEIWVNIETSNIPFLLISFK